MSRGPDPTARVAAALAQLAAARGIALVLTSARSSAWASATFVGTRHVLTMTSSDDPRLDALLGELPEAEFVIPGHVVIDCIGTAMGGDGIRAEVTIEALTIEEA